MRGLVRLVVCSFVLVCSPFAFADSLTNSVSITGNVTFDAYGLTFAPPFATQADTGYVAGFSNGTVNYLLGSVIYTDGLAQTVKAFTITDSMGNVLSFFDQVNTPTQTTDQSGNLAVTLDETGYYMVNTGPAIPGYFDVSFDGTSPDGASSDVPFLGSGALTGLIPITDSVPTEPTLTGFAPEPDSVLLLGTGLLAMAGLLRVRQKKVSVRE